jgi:hypothetical protein
VSAVAITSPADDNQQPNWELARALYLQGVKSSIIADECHVSQDALRQRIYREKWSKDRDRIKAKLSQVNQSTIGITLPSITEIGQNVRQLTAGATLKVAECLGSQKAPKTLKKAKELAEAVKAVVDPAEKLFAWSDQKATVVLHLGTLKSAKIPEAIDVQTSQVAQLPEAKQDTPPEKPGP